MAGILLMIFGLIVLPLGMIFYKAFVNKDFKQITNATLTCKKGHVSRYGSAIKGGAGIIKMPTASGG